MAAWSCGLQFRIIDGPGRGRTIPFDAPDVSIGRARNPGDRAPGWVLLNDETVSRVHAELIWDEGLGTFLLKHRSQTNLTYVNELPAEEVLLRVGDTVKLGSTVLELQAADTRFSGASGRPKVELPRNVTPVAPVQKEAPPRSVIPSFRDIEGEKPQSTKKAVRVAALTTRPDFTLEAVEGPTRDKRSIPITGLTLTLGSNPDQDLDNPPREGAWYDQEVRLLDPSIMPQGLALSWKEMQGGFSLWRPPHSTVRAKVVREMDGTLWTAVLEDAPILVKAGDQIQVGTTYLTLRQQG